MSPMGTFDDVFRERTSTKTVEGAREGQCGARIGSFRCDRESGHHGNHSVNVTEDELRAERDRLWPKDSDDV